MQEQLAINEGQIRLKPGKRIVKKGLSALLAKTFSTISSSSPAPSG
jgi:hypothetical protein